MPKLWGVNLAGAEFAPDRLPGTLGVDYEFPDIETYAYYAEQGIKFVRLPLLWERIQHGRLWHLDVLEMHRGLLKSLDAAAECGVQCLLELHNYGRYFTRSLTVAQDDVDAIRDVVGKLVEATTAHEAVYGYEVPCNEPHDLLGDPETTWRLAAETAEAVRMRSGKLIVWATPGWQSARFLKDNEQGFVWSDDDNSVLGVHNYGDGNFTGTYGVPYEQDVDQGYPRGPVQRSTMAERLQHAIDWAEPRGLRLLVTECGVPAGAPWLEMLEAFLGRITSNPSVLGAFLWAGGRRWPADYPLNLEPIGGKHKPQLALLKKFLV